MELHADAPSTVMPHALLGDAKVVATPAATPRSSSASPATADVEAYLGDVRHATVVEPDRRSPSTRPPGRPPRRPRPGANDIWVAQVSGTGTQEVTWPIEKGDWTVVVMNADGSAGVTADVAAGATVPALDWLVPTLLALAGIGLVGAVVLLVLALRPRRPGCPRPPARRLPTYPAEICEIRALKPSYRCCTS